MLMKTNNTCYDTSYKNIPELLMELQPAKMVFATFVFPNLQLDVYFMLLLTIFKFLNRGFSF